MVMPDDGLSGAGVASMMRAVRLHSPRGAEGLVLEEIETPSLEAREALVKVHAASITRDELEWPTDRLPAIPSYELSGVVVAVSPDVDSVSVGEPVYGLTGFDRDGVAAEYAAVPANVLAPKPRRLDHVESAAVPLAALSAWQGIVRSRRAGGGPASSHPRGGRGRRPLRDTAGALAWCIRDRHGISLQAVTRRDDSERTSCSTE